MSRIELPDGAWAEFIDVDQVTNGKRKVFLREMRKLADPATGYMDPLSIADLAVATFLTRWSYEMDLHTVENPTMDELTTTIGDTLMKAAGVVVQAITPDFGPDPTPGSPT